jgi:hypothetical protein
VKGAEQQALNTDAERRLHKILGRKPSAKEISELRHGEQALGLDKPASSRARQLIAESRTLRKTKNELLAALRQKRRKAKRLARAAAKR